MYKIIRHYFRTETAPRRRQRARGLTLEQAQAWCRDPETSSKTATSKRARARTDQYGPWFDGYEECRR